MNQSIVNTFLLAGLFLALFSIAEILYHILKIKVEYTRKIVHINTGLITLSFPILIDNHWLVLLLSCGFLLILSLSLRFNLLKSINAIDRISRGSLIYPIVVYGLFLVYVTYGSLLFFYLPILILAICDPLACLAGRKWPKGKYKVGTDTKTLVGSAAFFTSSLLVSIVLLLFFSELSLIILSSTSLIIATITTFAESLSQKGYDNLFIPLTALLIIIALNDFSIVI